MMDCKIVFKCEKEMTGYILQKHVEKQPQGHIDHSRGQCREVLQVFKQLCNKECRLQLQVAFKDHLRSHAVFEWTMQDTPINQQNVWSLPCLLASTGCNFGCVPGRIHGIGGYHRTLWWLYRPWHCSNGSWDRCNNHQSKAERSMTSSLQWIEKICGRFGGFLTDLDNLFLRGTDQYPKDLVKAHVLFSEWSDEIVIEYTLKLLLQWPPIYGVQYAHMIGCFYFMSVKMVIVACYSYNERVSVKTFTSWIYVWYHVIMYNPDLYSLNFMMVPLDLCTHMLASRTVSMVMQYLWCTSARDNMLASDCKLHHMVPRLCTFQHYLKTVVHHWWAQWVEKYMAKFGSTV